MVTKKSSYIGGQLVPRKKALGKKGRVPGRSMTMNPLKKKISKKGTYRVPGRAIAPKKK